MPKKELLDKLPTVHTCRENPRLYKAVKPSFSNTPKSNILVIYSIKTYKIPILFLQNPCFSPKTWWSAPPTFCRFHLQTAVWSTDRGPAPNCRRRHSLGFALSFNWPRKIPELNGGFRWEKKHRRISQPYFIPGGYVDLSENLGYRVRSASPRYRWVCLKIGYIRVPQHR